MTRGRLRYFPEPSLSFGSGQILESAKDGLFLFGPLQDGKAPGALRYGVIATADGLKHFARWCSNVRGFIPAPTEDSTQYRPFPGFANVFGVDFPEKPVCELVVDARAIDESLRIGNRQLAIHKTVTLFLEPIQGYLTEEEDAVDLWFVVIPEQVYTLGRPNSSVPVAQRTETGVLIDTKLAKALASTPSMFEKDNQAAEAYAYEKNFHNQLKARLLEGPHRPVIQVVRETAIAPDAFLRTDGRPVRRLQDPATVAWNLCTTAYFKGCGRPWKLARVREGVCYVGLVFKQVVNSASEGFACCGAQMFLDSGDGLVFKGAVGPWRSKESLEYHLSRESAQELIAMVVEAYSKTHATPPKELFIHAPSSFNDDEWRGFLSAVPQSTKLVGVRIRSTNSLKLFRTGQNPVIRGIAYLQSQRAGFLWTRGYVPYLKTYPGRENPNPLRIDITRGVGEIESVIEDILNLTKLNYNACMYGDGFPVTLRFADSVGEILTAGPVQKNQPPLPFKHYI